MFVTAGQPGSPLPHTSSRSFVGGCLPTPVAGTVSAADSLRLAVTSLDHGGASLSTLTYSRTLSPSSRETRVIVALEWLREVRGVPCGAITQSLHWGCLVESFTVLKEPHTDSGH